MCIFIFSSFSVKQREIFMCVLTTSNYTPAGPKNCLKAEIPNSNPIRNQSQNQPPFYDEKCPRLQLPFCLQLALVEGLGVSVSLSISLTLRLALFLYLCACVCVCVGQTHVDLFGLTSKGSVRDRST